MAKEWEIITKTNFWGQKSYEVREKNNSGGGCLILLVLIIGILAFAFTAPYRLIEPNFDVWQFNWVKDFHFWLYCLSAWSLLILTIIMLKAIWSFSKLTTNAFRETFDSPLITLGMFAACAAYFTAYLVKLLAPEAFIAAGVCVTLTIGMVYFVLTKNAEQALRAKVLIVSLLLITSCFVWINDIEIVRYSGSSEATEIQAVRRMVISANTVANIRSQPTTGSTILQRASNGTQIDAVLDSIYSGNSLWYKVQVAGVEGWVNGGLVRWE